MKSKYEVYLYDSKFCTYEIYYLIDGSEAECFVTDHAGNPVEHEIYSYATDNWIKTDIEKDLKLYDIKMVALTQKLSDAICEYETDLKENQGADDYEK